MTTEDSGSGLGDAPIEQVFELNPDGDSYRVVNEPNTGEPAADTDKEGCNGDVRVLQLPVAFAIEFRLSPKGKETYTVSRRYTPEQVKTITAQLRSGDAPELTAKLGDQQTEKIADDLERARNIAVTEVLADTVGHDVIKGLKDGKLSDEEVAHELGQQIEFGLNRRDE